MQYEVYDPTKHTLEVGTKIRLAGREGELKSWLLTRRDFHKLWGVKWSTGYIVDCGINGAESHLFDLEAFTFEIAVSPLTIDKRVKQEIKCTLSSWSHLVGGDSVKGLCKDIERILNSLEEM